MIRALPRHRAAADETRVTLAERWSNIVRMLVSLMPKARAVSEARPHYSGEFGNTESGLTPYDQMTPAEHDAAGEFWVMYRGDE